MKKVTLIGAGLAGSLLAVYLAKRGFSVDIFERRSDMRKQTVDRGRSINLALSTRGLFALEEVGLKDAIMKIAIPMRGRMMHGVDGSLTFQQYGKDETEVIYSVSRAELNKALMSLAENEKNVAIHFNERCTGMNFETDEVSLFNEEKKASHTIKTSPVIGTDGSASALRTDMQRYGRFNFSQEYLEHGYKELTIPAGANGKFLLEKNALHIWPRHSFMMIALPNLDGSFTCTLFLPFDGSPGINQLTTKEEVADFFNKEFPDAVSLMPTLVEDFFGNPNGSLITVKCSPWHVGAKAALLGDAAHAIVPFFGQGMNCAFEDCTVMNELIRKHEDDWGTIFSEFESVRKINTDAIADLAVENFFEMRDKVADPKFLLQKKVEHILEAKYPDIFIPKYSMVTFHRIPYSVALERGKIQDTILESACESIDSVDELDFQFMEHLLKKSLRPIETLS